MTKVLSIGSATVDVVAIVPNKEIEKISFSNDTSSFLMLQMGNKIELSSIEVYYGGGAVNAAISMQRLGVDVDCLVKVGDDKFGREIQCYLEDNQIGNDTVLVSAEHRTAMSIILSSHDGNPGVLTHRGANTSIQTEDINWDNMKQYDAFYIANLSGATVDLYQPLISFAHNHNIAIISNPGIKQIANSSKSILDSIAKVNLLVVNRVEATELLKLLSATQVIMHTEYQDSDDIIGSGRIQFSVEAFLRTLTDLGAQIAVMTDGKNGSYIYTDNKLEHIDALQVNPVATVGAGDAFISTLATLWLQGFGISRAGRLASNNAAAVVCAVDAHTNLMTYDALLKTEC